MGNQITEKISLSGLIEGFSNYVQTLRKILRHPLKFPESLETEGDNAFHNALGFVVYAIALLFFLLIPVFAEHHAELSKVTFLIRCLVQLAMYGVLLQLGLRLFGKSNKNLRSTLVVYFYIVGVGAPLSVILLYPILLRFGPAAMFGTAEDMIRLSTYYVAHPALLVYVNIVNLALGVISFVVVSAWFSHTHHVTKFRVILCLIATGAVGAVIQILVLHPLFLLAFKLIERWAKYA